MIGASAVEQDDYEHTPWSEIRLGEVEPDRTGVTRPTGQERTGCASLPDPVALETEEQTLEREQNKRDVLEALGGYKCGMSVENVPVVEHKNTSEMNYYTQVLQKS